MSTLEQIQHAVSEMTDGETIQRCLDEKIDNEKVHQLKAEIGRYGGRFTVDVENGDWLTITCWRSRNNN